MIEPNGLLSKLPQEIKTFLLIFLVTLSFGYIAGVVYISKTSGVSPNEVEEQYRGNEDNEDAEEMKFKKSERAILTLVHGHVITFSLIFLVLGGLFFLTSYPLSLKKVLAFEPLISTVTTFGGVWLMWYGLTWMKYVVMISGTLMHLSFGTLVFLIAKDLTNRK